MGKMQDVAAVNGGRIRVPRQFDESENEQTQTGKRGDANAAPQEKVQRMIVPHVELIVKRAREGHADQVTTEKHVDHVILAETNFRGVFEKLKKTAAVGQQRRRRPPEVGEDEK